MAEKKIPGPAYIIIGSAMVLMSVFIDVEKLVLFILVGAVFIVIGFIKILMNLEEGRKRRDRHAKHPHHRTSHHPSHHTSAKPASKEGNEGDEGKTGGESKGDSDNSHSPHHSLKQTAAHHEHAAHKPASQDYEKKTTTKQVVRCSQCGVKLHHLFKYCPNCGQKLK